MVRRWGGGAKRALIGRDTPTPRLRPAHASHCSPLSALVMVLSRLLRRRSLTALGATCASRGLGRSAESGPGWGRLTAGGAGVRGPVWSEGPGGCQSRATAVRPAALPEAPQRRPAARSRALGADAVCGPALVRRQGVTGPPRLTLFCLLIFFFFLIDIGF